MYIKHRFLLPFMLIFCHLSSAAEIPSLWQLHPAAGGAGASGAGGSGKPPESWALSMSPGLAALRQGEKVQVPLPDGHSQAGEWGPSRPTLSGGRRHTVHFAEPGSGLVLHLGLNASYGQLWTEDGSFFIETRADRSTHLRLPRQNADFDNSLTPGANPSPPSPPEPEPEPEVTDYDLDFLYLYDNSMIETYGFGLADLAASELAYLDTAFANARVPLKTELADLAFMDVAENYSSASLIVDAIARQGVFTDIQQRSTRLGVDILSLNREYDPARDNFCGAGYIFNPEEAVPVREQINLCHSGRTLAHETGHNLGLNHGLETDGTSGIPQAFGRGFRLDDESHGLPHFTSIMAAGSRNLQPQFSDPDTACPPRGSVCGQAVDPLDPESGADAARSLRLYAPGPATRGKPLMRLLSSVSSARSFGAPGQAATAILTVKNPNQVDGRNCRIAHHGPLRQSFSFRARDHKTANAPVSIARESEQIFYLSVTPSHPLQEIQFAPVASCDNIPMTETIQGVNTFYLSADTAGGPNLVMKSVTAEENGTVSVPAGGVGIYTVVAVNKGGAGAVTASVQSLDPGLPATGKLCRLDRTGACMATAADSVSLDINAGERLLFSVFVRTAHATPFDIRHRFQFAVRRHQKLRGVTSVAVRDLGAPALPAASDHSFRVRASKTRTGSFAVLASGYHDRYEITTRPRNGQLSLDSKTGSWRYKNTGPAAGGEDSFRWRAGNQSGWSQTGTVSVTVEALPLPVVQSFTVEDDIWGYFQVDLDDHAENSMEIDRFILTTPPEVEHEFDEVSGILRFNLPFSPGSISFSFRAENSRGLSNIASARVNIRPFSFCAPASDAWHRWLERLEYLTVSSDGETAAAEAERIAENLCLTDEIDRGSEYIQYRHGNHAFLIRFPDDASGYQIRLYSFAERRWVRQSRMCKASGRDSLVPVSYDQKCPG